MAEKFNPASGRPERKFLLQPNFLSIKAKETVKNRHVLFFFSNSSFCLCKKNNEIGSGPQPKLQAGPDASNFQPQLSPDEDNLIYTAIVTLSHH